MIKDVQLGLRILRMAKFVPILPNLTNINKIYQVWPIRHTVLSMDKCSLIRLTGPVCAAMTKYDQLWPNLPQYY